MIAQFYIMTFMTNTSYVSTLQLMVAQFYNQVSVQYDSCNTPTADDSSILHTEVNDTTADDSPILQNEVNGKYDLSNFPTADDISTLHNEVNDQHDLKSSVSQV